MDWLPQIDEYSKTPKYKQIIDSLVDGINNGNLTKDTKLPSVNQLFIEYDISRDTVVKAYEYLKSSGIIESVPGKGYYVKASSVRSGVKILLLFNKLSAHKKIIYDSFMQSLGEDARVDFYIYNSNFRLFKEIITTKLSQGYSHIVVAPHFREGGENVNQVLEMIPADKLIILDMKMNDLKLVCSEVYQDFEYDIYRSLIDATDHLKKYNHLKIIFPYQSYHPRAIIRGFTKYCQEYKQKHQIINNLDSDKLAVGDAYITLLEDDLVTLIKKCKDNNFIVGKDIGIISYNETPIKEILLNGITTISTNFEQLGSNAAQIIKKGGVHSIANPFSLILRASL